MLALLLAAGAWACTDTPGEPYVRIHPSHMEHGVLPTDGWLLLEANYVPGPVEVVALESEVSVPAEIVRAPNMPVAVRPLDGWMPGEEHEIVITLDFDVVETFRFTVGSEPSLPSVEPVPLGVDVGDFEKGAEPSDCWPTDRVRSVDLQVNVSGVQPGSWLAVRNPVAGIVWTGPADGTEEQVLSFDQWVRSVDVAHDDIDCFQVSNRTPSGHEWSRRVCFDDAETGCDTSGGGPTHAFPLFALAFLARRRR